ncbi:MAG: hypothetical protein B6D34_00765 [Candidatus Brocadia sp. UTAMX1]|nr:MAG: hypothetical protein B6D34_00765 [Candidatus Brocadia sp. UTAMX1]
MRVIYRSAGLTTKSCGCQGAVKAGVLRKHQKADYHKRFIGKSEAHASLQHKIMSEKKVATPVKSSDAGKRKKNRVLIVAIMVFGILLLIIQFSKQLGIEGFP